MSGWGDRMWDRCERVVDVVVRSYKLRYVWLIHASEADFLNLYAENAFIYYFLNLLTAGIFPTEKV